MADYATTNYHSDSDIEGAISRKQTLILEDKYET